MAGKACILASRTLAFALDELSKNALIDLIVDRAQAQIGAEMSDEQLAREIQGWIDPVIRVRGDRPVSLARAFARLDASEKAYRERTGKFTALGTPGCE